jgi:cell fate (sporulation/competence/biofilm development) regulator YlbF (YheA/YmcA/DUF963 family)
VAKKRRSKKSKKSRKQLMLLIVLLAILAGGGTWNYRRNLEAESREPRPYAGYSDEDIEKLVSAYRKEIDTLAGRYERVSGARVDVRSGTSIGEQVQEFERVQRRSRGVREIGYRLSEREATMKLLEQERARRVRDGDELLTFLRRVFTLPT